MSDYRSQGVAPGVVQTLNTGMPASPAAPSSQEGNASVEAPVIALVRDLMFASRISATAAARGSPVTIVRDSAKLPGQRGRLLLVDLNLDGAIAAAAAWQLEQAAPVVGFVSHVDADSARRARAAGIERVMARSQFVQVLEDLVSSRQVSPRPIDK